MATCHERPEAAVLRLPTASMRRAIKHLGSLMIALLIATILAPTFAWEMSEAQAAHAEPEGVEEAHGPGGQDAAAGLGDEEPHVLYGCAGHVLSHLPSLAETHGFPRPARAGQAHILERPLGAPQPFPSRLERPPSLLVRA